MCAGKTVNFVISHLHNTKMFGFCIPLKFVLLIYGGVNVEIVIYEHKSRRYVSSIESKQNI